VSALNVAFTYPRMMDELAKETAASGGGAAIFWATMAITFVVTILLWYMTAKRASNFARWVLVVLTVIGLLSLPFSLGEAGMGAAEVAVTLVTSAHLARLVAERLTRHADAGVTERYEKLRQFKRSQRPLVLLIGGSTGSGKSSLATEAAHRLDITRILSTDSVRHVMRAMISERLLPSIHRSSFEAWREPSALAAAGPGMDPTIGAFREQTQHVAVAVEAVLDRAVQENLSMILEGVHLVPGLFQRFAADTRLQFVHLVVWVEDETTHRSRFVARGPKTRDVLRPGIGKARRNRKVDPMRHARHQRSRELSA
jgi:hypothetical protein